MKTGLIFVLSLFVTTISFGQNMGLPVPQKTGGMPLMEALGKRSTSRDFDSGKDLTKQQLSNLLWAAFGINREDGKRTAPSALNYQEIEVYVLMKNGAFVYDAKSNVLKQLLAEDIRELGGTQSFVKDAPVTLVYIADFTKAGSGSEASMRETSGINAGHISQNVYLFCASEGLITGARLSIDKDGLGKKLGLRKEQWIVLAESVGYAK